MGNSAVTLGGGSGGASSSWVEENFINKDELTTISASLLSYVTETVFDGLTRLTVGSVDPQTLGTPNNGDLWVCTL